MAGISLRFVRSPEAPRMVMMQRSAGRPFSPRGGVLGITPVSIALMRLPPGAEPLALHVRRTVFAWPKAFFRRKYAPVASGTGYRERPSERRPARPLRAPR